MKAESRGALAAGKGGFTMARTKPLEELQAELRELNHKEAFLKSLLHIYQREQQYADEQAAAKAKEDEAMRIYRFSKEYGTLDVEVKIVAG